MPVSAETPIHIGLGALLASVLGTAVIVIGSFAYINQVSTSPLTADVASIRATLESLRGSGEDNKLNIRDTEKNLIEKINTLNLTLVDFKNELANVSRDLKVLDSNVVSLSSKIDSIEHLPPK